MASSTSCPLSKFFSSAGEDRDSVQKEHDVEALLILCAVVDLTHDSEEVRRVQPPRLLVEPARRAEIGETELDPRILDAIPAARRARRAARSRTRRASRSAPSPPRRDAARASSTPSAAWQERSPRRRAAAGRAHGRSPPAHACDSRRAGYRRRAAASRAPLPCRPRKRPGPLGAARHSIASLERALGDLGTHGDPFWIAEVSSTAARTSIFPVTASEMRAVRSSLRRSIASRTLAIREPIRAVSRSRKAAMAACSLAGGSVTWIPPQETHRLVLRACFRHHCFRIEANRIVTETLF